MAKTTRDVSVERLIDWGVDAAFGMPGDGINGIFEALRKNREKVRFIQVRHEEAAAFASPKPALVEAVVDSFEPTMLAQATPTQALHLAEALVRGQPDRSKIIASILQDKLRELI
jgi:hypothetical protein